MNAQASTIADPVTVTSIAVGENTYELVRAADAHTPGTAMTSVFRTEPAALPGLATIGGTTVLVRVEFVGMWWGSFDATTGAEVHAARRVELASRPVIQLKR